MLWHQKKDQHQIPSFKNPWTSFEVYRCFLPLTNITQKKNAERRQRLRRKSRDLDQQNNYFAREVNIIRFQVIFILFYQIRPLLAGSPQKHDANYCGPVTVPPPTHRGLRPLLLTNSVWVFLTSHRIHICKDCETGPTVLSSLSEKTRKSNRLQMSLVI